MRKFCKNHKFLCIVMAIIFVVIFFNFIYFLQDKEKHHILLHDVHAVADELEGSSEYADYMSGLNTEALRGCGRGQGKFGPGALQCHTRIELKGEVFGAWQTEHLLRSVADVLNHNGFLFDRNNLENMIPNEETEYLSEVVSLVHDKTKVKCGLRYEYLNDEERNEMRMYPVELPYVTISMGCDDMARLEQLLDKEIL